MPANAHRLHLASALSPSQEDRHPRGRDIAPCPAPNRSNSTGAKTPQQGDIQSATVDIRHPCTREASLLESARLSKDTYRYLLRIPEELRRRLNESAAEEGRSFKAEVRHRLEASFEAREHGRTARLLFAIRGENSRATPDTRGRSMSSNHVRLALVVVVLTAMIGVAVVAGLAMTDGGPSARGGATVVAAKGELPRGVLHRETVAGRGQLNTERGENPVTAEAEEYAARAYPAAAITKAQQTAAIQAFSAIQANGFPSGPLNTSSWINIGTTQAEYPQVLNRHGTSYTTAGRTTAMAIAPTCTTFNCRMWIGAAGGGIWRTDNALSSAPTWKFVSGSLGSNNFGVLTYDKNTGRLWAGTGEAHASGDSGAGRGIWYSDNGGNSWTGPIGAAQFSFRAISSIVVNGNTLYVGTTRAVSGVSSVTGGGVSLYPETPGVGIWKSTNGGATWTHLNATPTTVASGT